MKPPLTATRLRELLHYDPLTGVFTRLVSHGGVKAGDTAGQPDKDGYLKVKVDGRRYAAGRLGWFYVYGAWPRFEADHEDTVRSNNAFRNLRDLPHGPNQLNKRRAHKTNRLGVIGVRQVGSKFEARITINGDKLRLGRFDSPALATAAREACKAARLHHNPRDL